MFIPSDVIDGCPMGGPVSVIFQDIHMRKMEEDVVVTAKPIFYKRYIDDPYILEENSKKFLDIEIIRKRKTISTQVFTNLKKFPVH